MIVPPFGGPKLTDEQARPLAVGGASVALSSGAGCGKTTVLTARYLRDLEGPERRPLGEIVALTFTEKAARELRKRIRETCRNKLGAAGRGGRLLLGARGGQDAGRLRGARRVPGRPGGGRVPGGRAVRAVIQWPQESSPASCGGCGERQRKPRRRLLLDWRAGNGQRPRDRESPLGTERGHRSATSQDSTGDT